MMVAWNFVQYKNEFLDVIFLLWFKLIIMVIMDISLWNRDISLDRSNVICLMMVMDGEDFLVLGV